MWCLGQRDVLVVAEIDDLEFLHVSHLLRQSLQLVWVQEENGDVLQTAHLSDAQTYTWRCTADIYCVSWSMLWSDCRIDAVEIEPFCMSWSRFDSSSESLFVQMVHFNEPNQYLIHVALVKPIPNPDMFCTKQNSNGYCLHLPLRSIWRRCCYLMDICWKNSRLNWTIYLTRYQLWYNFPMLWTSPSLILSLDAVVTSAVRYYRFVFIQYSVCSYRYVFDFNLPNEEKVSRLTPKQML